MFSMITNIYNKETTWLIRPLAPWWSCFLYSHVIQRYLPKTNSLCTSCASGPSWRAPPPSGAPRSSAPWRRRRNQRTYLNGIVHTHKKTEKVFFLTTKDVRLVHHGWHGTHRYDIRVLATHINMCVAKTWISYRCVPCHPWCTRRTSLVVKKNFFQFSCGCEQFH